MVKTLRHSPINCEMSPVALCCITLRISLLPDLTSQLGVGPKGICSYAALARPTIILEHLLFVVRRKL